LNLGVRYDVTLPPITLNDQYSDFTHDRPNPKVNNYPGALRFAGFGAGHENARSLVPGWYGGVGPRIGIAFAPTDKMTFRAAFGRSFSKVTVVSSSGHFAGFIGRPLSILAASFTTPQFKRDATPIRPTGFRSTITPRRSNFRKSSRFVKMWARFIARSFKTLFAGFRKLSTVSFAA
jgi:hypothetical protein